MYRKNISNRASNSLYRRTARKTNVVNISCGMVPRGGFRLWKNTKLLTMLLLC